jgi:hypothetical protein
MWHLLYPALLNGDEGWRLFTLDDGGFINPDWRTLSPWLALA